MNGFCPRLAHRIDDLVLNQITLRGRRWPDMDGLIGHLDSHRASIGIGIDNDCFNAESSACFGYSNCNFATVCDEYFLEHIPPA